VDFYSVLGLKPTATLTDIKRAYRRLARRFHPDINPGDPTSEARFRQISDAYETLIDPERRRQYDQQGQTTEETSSVTFGFEGFDFTVQSAEGPRASTFGDLFAEVIQQGVGYLSDRQSGADLHARLELSFDEAVRGLERPVTVTRLVACATCGGSGAVRTPEAQCLRCNGTGALRSARGHMVFTKSCPRCGGTGRQSRTPCGRCGGSGVEARAEAVVVRVSAGTADGTLLCLAGWGNCGRHGGRPGDLYVTVAVAPHPLFQRQGDDLHFVVSVAVHEAGLGARIDIPTPDGPARLRVPPGAQSGQRFRLRERGVPSPRDGRRGDLIVEIRIVLPPLLDERSKELLREFGRINAESVRDFSPGGR
jgi:molecular chaperone DnaJ